MEYKFWLSRNEASTFYRAGVFALDHAAFRLNSPNAENVIDNNSLSISCSNNRYPLIREML